MSDAKLLHRKSRRSCQELAQEVASEAQLLVNGLKGAAGGPETTLVILGPLQPSWREFVQLSGDSD